MWWGGRAGIHARPRDVNVGGGGGGSKAVWIFYEITINLDMLKMLQHLFLFYSYLPCICHKWTFWAILLKVHNYKLSLQANQFPYHGMSLFMRVLSLLYDQKLVLTSARLHSHPWCVCCMLIQTTFFNYFAKISCSTWTECILMPLNTEIKSRLKIKGPKFLR